MPTLEEMYPGKEEWFADGRADGLTDNEQLKLAGELFGSPKAAAPATSPEASRTAVKYDLGRLSAELKRAQAENQEAAKYVAKPGQKFPEKVKLQQPGDELSPLPPQRKQRVAGDYGQSPFQKLYNKYRDMGLDDFDAAERAQIELGESAADIQGRGRIENLFRLSNQLSPAGAGAGALGVALKLIGPQASLLADVAGGVNTDPEVIRRIMSNPSLENVTRELGPDMLASLGIGAAAPKAISALNRVPGLGYDVGKGLSAFRRRFAGQAAKEAVPAAVPPRAIADVAAEMRTKLDAEDAAEAARPTEYAPASDDELVRLGLARTPSGDIFPAQTQFMREFGQAKPPKLPPRNLSRNFAGDTPAEGTIFKDLDDPEVLKKTLEEIRLRKATPEGEQISMFPRGKDERTFRPKFPSGKRYPTSWKPEVAAPKPEPFLPARLPKPSKADIALKEAQEGVEGRLGFGRGAEPLLPTRILDAIIPKSRPGRAKDWERNIRSLGVSDVRVKHAQRGVGNRLAERAAQADKAGEAFQALPKNLQDVVHDVHTGVRKVEDFPPELKTAVEKGLEAAAPSYKIAADNHRRAFGLGLISRATYEKNINHVTRGYLASMVPGYKAPAVVKQDAIDFLIKDYAEKGQNITVEQADDYLEALSKKFQDKTGGVEAGPGTSAATLKARKDIPEPIRRYLGEVKGHLATELTIADQGRLIEHAQYHRDLVEDMPRLIDEHPDEMVIMSKIPKYMEAAKRMYPHGPEKVMGQVLTQPVPRWVADNYIEQSHVMKHGAKFIAALTSIPKRLVTSWNPGTHKGNLMGNAMLSVFTGTSIWNPANTMKYVRGVIEYAKRGKMFKEMTDSGGLGPGFVTKEGRAFIDNLADDLAKEAAITPTKFMTIWKRNKDRATKAWGKSGGIVDEIYDAEDGIFKLVAYTEARTNPNLRIGGERLGRPATPAEANEHATMFYPDYGLTGDTISGLRKTTAGQLLLGDFAAYPIQAVRISKNVAKHRKTEAALLAGTIYTLQKFGGRLTGVSDEDAQAARDALPLDKREAILIPYNTGADTGDPRKDVYFHNVTNDPLLASIFFGYRADPSDTPLQEAGGRVAHGLKSVLFSRALRGEYGAAEQETLGTLGNLGEDVKKSLTPPSITRTAQNALARARGKETDRYGAPLPAWYRTLSGTTPVTAEGSLAGRTGSAQLRALERRIKAELRDAAARGESPESMARRRKLGAEKLARAEARLFTPGEEEE
jgi:hypothetical protein